MVLRTQGPRPCVVNRIGMSWETTEVLSADTTDVLSADTTDVLSADTTDVLSADTTGLSSANTRQPKFQGLPLKMVFGHNLHLMAPFELIPVGFCAIFWCASFMLLAPRAKSGPIWGPGPFGHQT